jgi:ABC-type transport system substrate-binding protein
MGRRISITALAAVSLCLTSCGGSDDGQFDVAFIDSQANLFADGIRLSQSGQHLRAATRSGLVALNQQGEVVPALAESWNVIEGGSIFIFRLREGDWPNGEELTAESVRRALDRAIRNLRGTSLALDLAPIDDVRAMAGRVIEVRLSSAMPDLLRLLAQPELGLVHGEGETGPLLLEREDANAFVALRPPEERGLPLTEDWQEFARSIRLHALTSEQATERFANGEIEVVLGGTLGDFPLVDTGPLSRGTVRVDPAYGLFGLQVRRARGVLETPELREAFAMVIDRSELMEPFNLGGWVATTRIVAPELPAVPSINDERWQGLSIDQRRSEAASRFSAWRSRNTAEENAAGMALTLEIGEAPGLEILLQGLAAQFAELGITITRAQEGETADLVLVDSLARYAAPMWFLNQFNCVLDKGLCSERADVLASEALDELDAQVRAGLLAEAEGALMQENAYIPIGSPLRWSLVRGNVDGFSGNRWAFHPLPDMAVIPR